MAKRDKNQGTPGTGLWSTDFELNISGRQALREIGNVEAAIDRVQRKVEKLNATANPLSSRGGLGVNPAMLQPGFSGQIKGVYRDASGRNTSWEEAVLPQYQRQVNPMPVVFSENALSGGQVAKRRDPTPVVGDSVIPDNVSGQRSVRREPTNRSRNPQTYTPPERYETAFEQRTAHTPTALYPSQEMSRRERVLQQRFLRDDLYSGRQVERARDRGYTVIGPSGQIMGALPGPVAPETFSKRFDPAPPSLYPTQEMSRRQRVLQQRFMTESPYPGGAQAAADRMYNVIPPSGQTMGALPAQAGYAQGSASQWFPTQSSPTAFASRWHATQATPWGPSDPRRAPLDPAGNPFMYSGPYSVWNPSMGARARFTAGQAAGAVLPLHDQFQAGMHTLGGGARAAGRVLSPHNLMGVASGVFVAEALGRTVGQLGQRTVGESMRIDEYQSLLANSLLSDQLERPAAERLSERLVNSEYFAGMDMSTSELGLSQAALAEQFKGLAPIVRVGASGPQDFVQRMQRGALASTLLLARDPSQGQAGVNVALSELLAGGSTRFLSLSRRFELSNSQLRRIEAEEGGEGVADPVLVAIRALEEMGIGPEYLKTRAQTMSGELAQSGALFANLRADAFERGTGVLAQDLSTVNSAFSMYRNTEAYGRQLEAGGSGIARAFNFVTQPLTQGIAGNLLRHGGALDEQYLARSASELMQTRQGEFTNAAGEIVSAAEAFREAALTIQEAHLERLLEQPEYDASQQTRADTLLTAGATVGGTMLLNRLLGGAGGMLLRSLVSPAGAAAAGITAGAAAAAALPAMVVGGTALAVGATVASARRAGTTRDIYGRISEDNPQLLDDLNLSGPQRRQMERFAGRGGVVGSAYQMAMYNRDWVMNHLTGGRFGEATYGERGGTFGTAMAELGQQSEIENAIADMGLAVWEPGMNRQTYQGRMREQVLGFVEEARANPDTPAGQWLTKEGNAEQIALDAADRSWETAPRDANRAMLSTAMQRAFAYSQPFGMVDPETGERVQLREGFTLEQGERFVNRIVEDDPTLPGIVDQGSLNATISDVGDRLERKLADIEEGQQETVTIWRRLNLSMLPGVFSDYDPNADLREIIPSRTPVSALGVRDRSQLYGGGNLKSGAVQVPAEVPIPMPGASATVTRSGEGARRPSMPVLQGLTEADAREAKRLGISQFRYRDMGLAGTASEGRGEVQARDFQRASAEETAAFYGGSFSGKDHEDHLHGGFDVLASAGYNSPTGGEVTYLRTQEDYNQPLYEQMFPGGRDIYGVSAVVQDRFGKVHSVSHLQDLPSYKDGPVAPGDFIGAQGNSGLSYSSAFPGERIQDGILPDGSSANGRGSHGHVQFGQLTDDGYEFLDPQLGPSYWQASDAERAGMGNVTFNVQPSIFVERGADRETQRKQLDLGVEEFRRELYRLLLDGSFDEMQETINDIKRSQGNTGDPTRPAARGK